jgi:hypothetical protein
MDKDIFEYFNLQRKNIIKLLRRLGKACYNCKIVVCDKKTREECIEKILRRMKNGID